MQVLPGAGAGAQRLQLGLGGPGVAVDGGSARGIGEGRGAPRPGHAAQGAGPDHVGMAQARARRAGAGEEHGAVAAAGGEIPGIGGAGGDLRRGAGGEGERRQVVQVGEAVRGEGRLQRAGRQGVEDRAERLVEQDDVGRGLHRRDGGAGEGGGLALFGHRAGDGAQVGPRERDLRLRCEVRVVAGAQEGGELGARDAVQAGIGGDDRDPTRAEAARQQVQRGGAGRGRHHVGGADEVDHVELAQLVGREGGGIAVQDPPALAQMGAAGAGAGAGVGRGVDADHAARAVARSLQQLGAGAAADVQHIEHRAGRRLQPQRRRGAAQGGEAERGGGPAVVGDGVVGAADLGGEAGAGCHRWRQGRPEAFQPAMRPRWPWPSGLPSKPSATLKALGKPAAWAAWAAARERTPERQRK